MARTGFILILLVVVLIGRPPMILSAEGLSAFIQAEKETQKARREERREIRQQRADAQAEVLFWFRTHPTERVLPKKEVDRMLKSRGYFPSAVEGLTGSRNPFFVDLPRVD